MKKKSISKKSKLKSTKSKFDNKVNSSIQKIFLNQKKNVINLSKTSVETRIEKLKKILKYIQTNQLKIQEAIFNDFKKPASEVDLTEIFVVNIEIKHAIRHLKRWVKPKRILPTLAFLTTSSSIVYEPKGVVLIIAPWNFPFNLTLGPIVSAIAAGNAIIVKPSEMTPHTSRLIKNMIEELFPQNEISVIEGDADVSKELLKLPFDHIFFTGSPAVGKYIMSAAAQNLTTVTLELGGKSPVVVDKSANLKDAAEKIVWGKFLNAGQACIAPDYLLVHQDVQDSFLKHVKSSISKYYGNTEEEIQKSNDYARIVNPKHFNRIVSLLQDAKKNGAIIEAGGEFDSEENYISPTILTKVSMNSKIMQEEIFGPILPVISIKSIDDAINLINANEKPLALYIFSSNKQITKDVIESTFVGGTCVNETMLQFLHPNLPFGGINNSGFGNSHGYFGFKAFSHERAILKHHSYSLLKILYPPYTGFVKKLIQIALKVL